MTYKDLRRDDLLVLLRVVWVLGRWIMLRRRLPLPELLASLCPAAPDAPPASRVGPAAVDSDLERAVRLTRAVLRRTHRRRFCLPQSVILMHLLRHARHPAVFHLGVATRNGELVAHAWIDVDGLAVAERTDPRTRFTVVFSHPATASADRASEASRTPVDRHSALSDAVCAPPALLSECTD